MGESLAGLFVVETMFLEPELFDTYIAFDPSIWWNDNEFARTAATRLRAGIKGPRTLYLASSDEEELARLTKQLAESLEKNAPPNLKWSYHSMPAETHGTIYHPAALQALRRLFKPEPDRR
jgi:predicted alpha/beta superfamily hydrolase